MSILSKHVRDFSFRVSDQASWTHVTPLGLVPVVTSLDVQADAACDVSLYIGGTVAATLTVDCTNAHSDVTFTSLRMGPSGTGLNIIYTDPSAASQSLSVGTTVNSVPATGGWDIDIDISLATNGASAITSTGMDIIDLINQNATTRKLVKAEIATSNNGSGVVEAKTTAALASNTNTLKWMDTLAAAGTIYKSWAPGTMMGTYAGDDIYVVLSAGTNRQINCSGFYIPGTQAELSRSHYLTAADKLDFTP